MLQSCSLVHRRSGFTLLEMSIVLVIVGIVSAGLLGYAKVNHRQAKFKLTHERLDVIQDAIQLHVQMNNTLPCPAERNAVMDSDEFGVVADCHSSSTVAANRIETGDTSGEDKNDVVWLGTVPTRSLNLPDRYMVDAWEGRFSYGIIRELAIRDIFNNDGSLNYVVNDPSANNLVIHVTDGTQNVMETDIGGTRIAIGYILISHGENNSGAFLRVTQTGDSSVACGGEIDAENCDFVDAAAADVDFIDKRINFNSGNYFDDVVRWKPIHHLRQSE